MYSRPFGKLGRVLLAGCVLGMGASMVLAQSSSSSAAASTTTSTASSDQNPSRMDVFLGYSYLAPHGTVTTLVPHTGAVTNSYSSINEGAIGSFAYFFNRYVGGQLEYANHPDGANDGAQDFGLGLIFRAPMSGMTPFAHATAGLVRLGGPNVPDEFVWHGYTWGPALTVGGGLDYELPFRNHRFALRLFQADFQYYHVDFGAAPQVGGRANVNSARLSTGIVVHMGSIVPPPPVGYSCSASPDSVYPGEQVTVTGTATNLNPKKPASYSWSGQGLTVSGTNSSTTIDTANLQPGDYKVSGHVTEGNKPGQSADCTAQFTVKQFEPPTVSCTANPTTVQPGGTSTITATGVSPQNRQLDVQLLGFGGIDQRNDEHGNAVDDRSAVGNGHRDVQRAGRQGADGFVDDVGRCGSAAAAAGTEDADAVLDHVQQGHEKADARGQRSEGVPGRCGAERAAEAGRDHRAGWQLGAHQNAEDEMAA